MLEYIDEEHLYLYNGVIIPSVSEILHKYIFKEKYKDIPKHILEKKAKYGTEIHKAIENLENFKEYETSSIWQELSIEQYLDIKAKEKIKVLEQEKMICFKGLYAGRFDMRANVNDKESLIDIKTTSELDLDYVSWQLSLYELGYGKEFEKLYVLWLPKKRLGKLIEVERKSKKEIEKILEEIEKNDKV